MLRLSFVVVPPLQAPIPQPVGMFSFSVGLSFLTCKTGSARCSVFN